MEIRRNWKSAGVKVLQRREEKAKPREGREGGRRARRTDFGGCSWSRGDDRRTGGSGEIGRGRHNGHVEKCAGGWKEKGKKERESSIPFRFGKESELSLFGFLVLPIILTLNRLDQPC